MNVTIVAVDKLREDYLRTGCELLVKRLKPYWNVRVIETRKSGGPDAMAHEGREIARHIGADDIVWALDRQGEQLASMDLVQRIAAVERSGRRRFVLVIGGPEGLDDGVLARSEFRWSLSRLTLLHEMARLVVLEQLYRAAKIGRGEPYHR